MYERHAYVLWNVALRTALDDEAAGSAARRAFAAQVTHPDESRLAVDTARLAVDAAGGVDARGVEQPVLAATAHLAAVQRAVLALAELTDVPPREVAAKLGIDSERERQLRERAFEQLGLLLAVAGDRAREAYEDVPWAEPPAELWQALYPELHAAVTQEAQTAAESVPGAAVTTERRAARRLAPRRFRGATLAGVAALAVAGVAWAATGGGDNDSGASDTGDYAGLPTSDSDDYSSEENGQAGADSATSLLSPEELDRLRRNEIEQLKRFARRKDDQQLPQQKRERAARKVSDLLKVARARQRAAEERELALRRQLAREREARYRERSRREDQDDEEHSPSSEPQTTQEPQRQNKQPTGGKKPGGGGGGDRDPVETECLYDPDNGTYICPE
jgi:hypothetical protein